MVYQRDRVDQARADMLKTIRAAVRLRHSIAADNELNEVLPKAEQAFDIQVHNGELPDPLGILEALGVEA
jgi:hypothetical protein